MSLDLSTLQPHPFAARRAAASEAIAASGTPGVLLVEHPANVRYLSGFTGSAGVLLVSADGAVELITDERYRERAAEECGDLLVVVDDRAGQREQIIERAVAGGGLALEADHVTWARQREWSDALGSHDVPVSPTQRVVETLRMVKDDAEIDRIGGRDR